MDKVSGADDGGMEDLMSFVDGEQVTAFGGGHGGGNDEAQPQLLGQDGGEGDLLHASSSASHAPALQPDAPPPPFDAPSQPFPWAETGEGSCGADSGGDGDQATVAVPTGLSAPREGDEFDNLVMGTPADGLDTGDLFGAPAGFNVEAEGSAGDGRGQGFANGGGVDEWEQKLSELEAMGFPRGNSQAALAVAEGNLTSAVEILTGS